MTQYTNKDLIRHFVRGGSDGQANRMAIQETDDFDLLWGYGWALYAARRKSDGAVFVYQGWSGFSNTTTTHIRCLVRKAKKHKSSKAKPDAHVAAKVSVGSNESTVEMSSEPPSGDVVALCPEAEPSCKYSRLKTERNELEDVSVTNPPEGYGDDNSRFQ